MRGLTAPLLKIVVFAVVTVVLTAVLATTIANSSFSEQTGYTARFADASGLHDGDEVRVSGVKVGQVSGITVAADNVADVRFDVDASKRLPAATTATVKFRNLIGQRYLALGTDVPGGGRLRPGAVIGQDRTRPALNLTVLFNGFKPLFQAIDPRQINQLSQEMIQVFQGEGGTLQSLLAHTASLTTTIARKDDVIGQVITNLNQVIGNVNQRSPQLEGTIDAAQQMVSGLAEQRKPIGDAVSAMGRLTDAASGLLADARPALRQDVAHLGDLAKPLAEQQPALDDVLSNLPGNMRRIGRATSYGSWFNYYSCSFTLRANSRTVGKDFRSDLVIPVFPLPGTQRPERCGP